MAHFRKPDPVQERFPKLLILLIMNLIQQIFNGVGKNVLMLPVHLMPRLGLR